MNIVSFYTFAYYVLFLSAAIKFTSDLSQECQSLKDVTQTSKARCTETKCNQFLHKNHYIVSKNATLYYVENIVTLLVYASAKL